MNILLVGSLGKMSTTIKDIAPQLGINIVGEIDKNFGRKTIQNFVKQLAEKTNKNENKINYNFLQISTAKKTNKAASSSNQNCFSKFINIPVSLIEKIDVVLDFSAPQILDKEIEFCTSHKLPLVICTTGHNDNQKKLIENASKTIPIFYSANTSLSINLIGEFIKKYVEFFKTFDIDIVETHHKSKLDSPSGTAKFFAQNLSPLSPTIHSIRAGKIVGEHQIIFTSPYEKIVLSHAAFDRKLFADGALKICKFLHKKTSPKLYTMDDIFDTYFLLAPQNGQV